MEKELWVFLEKVQEMRMRQRQWFQNHDSSMLQEAKRLEKEIDKMAEELQAKRRGETLFKEPSVF